MDLTSLVIFAGALFVAAGSPGPSVAALVARVVSKGSRDVMPFLAAMWIGEGIWLSMAVFGLAIVAQTFHFAFLVLKWAGVAYLCLLAYRMWTAPVSVEESDLPRAKSSWKMFAAGLAVTLGNPKIMMFYMALLPTIIDLASVTMVGWLELTAAMALVLMAVDLAWVAAAVQARRIIRSPRAMRIANRVSASIMGGAAAAIASR
ncbi:MULTISPECIES: LysE family translocator [unclassified Aminobacter]|uniref:LysE family translocator n=1 Tax=unclassified Aminobacter TaxID=2644704 RepID=UPI00046315CB|nr:MULTISPECIES: LysE family translocator [unclassified Aminobacter]TWH35465.1 threonine/homoserine/homoserine lactone efflux protein [Aminobacter sp. J15]